MGKRWTEREVDRLKSLWLKGLTSKVIASKIKDRSVASVRVKLHSMQKQGIIDKRNKQETKQKTERNKNKNLYGEHTPYTKRNWPYTTVPKEWDRNYPAPKKKNKEWDSQRSIVEMLKEIESFLLTKNDQYGDSALAPIRIFSKSDKSEQLKVRIDDKLNRLMQGNASIETDEDVIKDLIGYLVLLLINIRDTQ